MDDVRSDGLLIFSSHRVNGSWFVSNELKWRSGKAEGTLMANGTRSDTTPPERGWMFATTSSSPWSSPDWSSTDSSLQCSRQPTSRCNVITVKLAGEAGDKLGSWVDGRYLVVEDSFIKGRRVSL